MSHSSLGRSVSWSSQSTNLPKVTWLTVCVGQSKLVSSYVQPKETKLNTRLLVKSKFKIISMTLDSFSIELYSNVFWIGFIYFSMFDGLRVIWINECISVTTLTLPCVLTKGCHKLCLVCRARWSRVHCCCPSAVKFVGDLRYFFCFYVEYLFVVLIKALNVRV